MLGAERMLGRRAESEQVTRRCRRSKTCWRTGKVTSHVAIQRLIEMG